MVGENTTLLGGIVAAATLIALDRLLKLLVERSSRARNVIEGEARMLVRDGTVLIRALREEGVDQDELDAALRAHGIADVADVGLAVLETDGTISVIASRGSSATKPPDGIR
jgi:uncharacterized membrane protein YcaP (DUF421 family)